MNKEKLIQIVMEAVYRNSRGDRKGRAGYVDIYQQLVKPRGPLDKTQLDDILIELSKPPYDYLDIVGMSIGITWKGSNR